MENAPPILSYKRMRLPALMFAVSAFLISCGVNSSEDAATKAEVSVVSTTGMIADAARSIGGEAVSLTALMGPGVDPHAFRQTQTDIVAMTRADLTLSHGLYLEAQLEDFLTKLSTKRAVLAVADKAPKEQLIAHEDYADKYDPHIWMVPELWAAPVGVIRDALKVTAPDGAKGIEARAATYLDEVKAVGQYARSVLSTVPQQSRVLITAHDAFNYFGRAYGFEVIGIQGISTESEAGLKRISELVDLIVQRNIKAVFIETSVSDRNVKALIEGAKARGHDVQIGGELYSDSMGADGTYEGTYVGMIDHNATVIARALGGEAPEKGWQGLMAGKSE